MQSERERVRYAHSEGHTDVVYANEGKHLLTCGSDGDVRIWSGFEDDDPTSECFGEMAMAVAYSNKRFYVGTENHYVQACTFPDAQRDGITSRFSAPVTHIVTNNDGSLVVAGSCDMEIQVTEIATNKISKLVGHTAPVLGVALDPLSKYVVSSSCDGSVKVWLISSCSVAKTFSNVVPVCNDFFRSISLCRPAWKPDSGSYLAIPTEKEVMIYERDTWKFQFKLYNAEIQKLLSIVIFSPCGKYLAACSIAGEIIVWDVSKGSTISYTEHPKKAAISGIAWSPSGNEIAFCDRLGQLGVICVSNLVKPESSADTGITINEAISKVNDENDGSNDASDDENAISLNEIKASTNWMSPSKMDEDQISLDKAETESRSDVYNRMPLTDIQTPFQPSSTPVHFQHRFMLWNSIGIVRCYNTEEEKSIDVEFHDTMLHHAIHMNNHDEYTLASLSDKVLSLACPSDDETPSKLTCILLNAWDGSKEWSITMPEGENILAVAAHGDWVAVATDANHLRIYSHAGTQRQILSLAGAVVSISGHNQQLLVVCHNGMGLPGCQSLSFTLYKVSTLQVRAVVSNQVVPLFPKSIVKWIGFTDEGTPCIFDSEGILRAFSVNLHLWTVLCDARLHLKSSSDHYFIIGLSEKYQNIRCVLCKGSFYPMTTPRPTVVEVPLKIPYCEPETEKSIQEDVFWRHMFSLPTLQSLAEVDYEIKSEVNDFQKTLKQAVIKLFANACRSDADMRATDVATFMSEQPLQMAIKYASKFGKMYLAEKLNKINSLDWDNLREGPLVLESSKFHSFGNSRTSFQENHNNKNDYSQDMFEESQPGKEDNLLLLAAEKEESSNTNFSFPTNKTNPFKVKDKQEGGPKGLSFFDHVKNVPVPPKQNKVLPKPQHKVLKPKSVNKAEVDNTPPKKPTFVQWLAVHKAAMKEQFPDLEGTDFTKACMKKFREESSKENGESNSEKAAPQGENKKRKIDDVSKDETTAKKAAATKLSLFAFEK